MQNHPTEDELVRLCLARGDEPGAPAARAHLEAGCPECSERVRELRVVLASLAAPALHEVPEAMFDRALAWVTEQERASGPAWAPAQDSAAGRTAVFSGTVHPTAAEPVSRRGVRDVLQDAADGATRILAEIRASLVLDSPAGAALQGVRGSAMANVRQLLYESPAGSILLLVEPAGDGPTNVQGQFLPAEASMPVTGARAVIDVDGRTTAVPLSSTGEFRFEGVPPGTIRLCLETGASRVVLDPLEP